MRKRLPIYKRLLIIFMFTAECDCSWLQSDKIDLHCQQRGMAVTLGVERRIGTGMNESALPTPQAPGSD